MPGLVIGSAAAVIHSQAPCACVFGYSPEDRDEAGRRAPEPTTAPVYDLSACSLPQLARLYETWEAIFHHLSAAGNAPCFLDSDRNFTPAGEVLDQEYDRAGHFLSVIADEATKRAPVTARDRDERLNVLVRHEMNTNGRPVDGALLAELNAVAKG